MVINLIRNKFFFLISIFIILSIFFAPIYIVANEYAFISAALNFFNQNDNYIGHTESIRTGWLKFFFFYFYNFFGYEIGWKISRILSLIFFSYAFYHFSLSFRFSNISILISILIFSLAKQSFFGTEYILGTFEFKVIAYILVILSLSFLERRSFLKSIILISLAIYSHFLVGYFWFGVICIYYYLNKRNFKEIFKYFIKVFLITFPLLLILIYENYYINLDPSINYNNIFLGRLSGLTNPYNQDWSLKSDWILGYVIILINIFLLFFLKKNVKNIINNNFLLLIILLNFYLIFLTFLLYFDRSFFIAKFIPFRPESLTLLFSLFIITELSLVLYFKKTLKKKVVILFILTILLSSPAIFNYKYNLIRASQIITLRIHYVFTNINKPLKYFLEIDDLKLLNWVRNKTSEDDIIIFEDGFNYSKRREKDLILFSKSDRLLVSRLLSSSWEVISGRPAYVNADAIGGNFKELIKWSKRLKEKREIYNGNCEVIKNTSIKYAISFTENKRVNLSKCLKKKSYQIGKYNIFKINNK
tara:strand:- start:1776 stop:3371 length:1596 start_codon:yes stop_codon:yes gene_type:complete